MMLVTHQIQFIKFVDHVVIMDNGKILAAGAFEELDVMNVFKAFIKSII